MGGGRGGRKEGLNYRLLCPAPSPPWLVLKKKGGKKGGQREGWEGGGKEDEMGRDGEVD